LKGVLLMILQFDTSTTLGDIVASDYRAAGVFDQYGIDFCCGGKRSFGEACAAARLDPGAVSAELAKVSPTPGSGDAPDASWPVDELEHYIVLRHHSYVRQQLPVIAGHLESSSRSTASATRS
jgi:regulator of cell morphogenesis and NO signaling